MSDGPLQEGYRVAQIRKTYVLPNFCLALTFIEEKGQIRRFLHLPPITSTTESRASHVRQAQIKPVAHSHHMVSDSLALLL